MIVDMSVSMDLREGALQGDVVGFLASYQVPQEPQQRETPLKRADPLTLSSLDKCRNCSHQREGHARQLYSARAGNEASRFHPHTTLCSVAKQTVSPFLETCQWPPSGWDISITLLEVHPPSKYPRSPPTHLIPPQKSDPPPLDTGCLKLAFCNHGS